MKDKRPFWQTKTFWGCALLFVAGGLKALGANAEYWLLLKNLAEVLGVPLAVYGVADRLRK